MRGNGGLRLREAKLGEECNCLSVTSNLRLLYFVAQLPEG
jgi:hypothetical protein